MHWGCSRQALSLITHTVHTMDTKICYSSKSQIFLTTVQKGNCRLHRPGATSLFFPWTLGNSEDFWSLYAPRTIILWCGVLGLRVSVSLFFSFVGEISPLGDTHVYTHKKRWLWLTKQFFIKRKFPKSPFFWGKENLKLPDLEHVFYYVARISLVRLVPKKFNFPL